MARVRPIPTMTAADVQSFVSRIQFAAANDCWIYRGAGVGYGAFCLEGRLYRATRIAAAKAEEEQI